MTEISDAGMPDFKGTEDQEREFHIRFTSPKGNAFPVFSLGIKALTGWWDASHVQLWWSDPWFKEELVYEASGTEMHYKGDLASSDKWHIEHEFVIKVKKPGRWRTIKWCLKHAGLKYSIREIIGFIPIALARRLFKKNIQNPFATGHTEWFCSKMIAHILEDVWGILDVEANMSNADPADIFLELIQACADSPDRVTYIGGRKAGSKMPKKRV